MDFDKINSILGKFRRMQDGLQESGDDISHMEKQLLLSYLDEAKSVISGVVTSTPILENTADPIQEEITSNQNIEEDVTDLPNANEVEDVTENLTVSEELYNVFDLDDGNEISDRLSKAPISDLTKAMSINERIFTVQELFSGDQNGFQAALKDLNGLADLSEARDYLLSHVAVKNGWDSPNKIKKAGNFVKLIARRYL